MVALDPVLQLAGTVARVGADFEISNEDDLGLKRGGLCEHASCEREDEGDGEASVGHGVWVNS